MLKRLLSATDDIVKCVMDYFLCVEHIFSTDRAFAIKMPDGSVITWENGGWGGNCLSVQSKLIEGDCIFSTQSAFAAKLPSGGNRLTQYIRPWWDYTTGSG